MAEGQCGSIEEEEEIPAIKACRRSNGKSLDLSRLKLNAVPNKIFELVQIQNLYLEGNTLREIPLQFAESLIQLTWLDLRHNKLESLPTNICLLISLKKLLLEGNQIVRLPVELGLLTQLVGLNLKDNPLEFPPRNIIEQGPKVILKYLREQYNLSCQVDKLDLKDDGDEKDEEEVCFTIESEVKNPVNSDDTQSSSFGDNTIDEKIQTPILEQKEEEKQQISVSLSIGKAKINHDSSLNDKKKVSRPPAIKKSSSFPAPKTLLPKNRQITSSVEYARDKYSRVNSFSSDKFSTGYSEKPIVSRSVSNSSFPSSESVKISKKKIKPKVKKETKTDSIRDILQKTDLDLKKGIGKPDFPKTILPPIKTETKPSEENSTIANRFYTLKDLKVGDMVLMNVSPEHHIPGQPCIGEIKTVPLNQDFIVVHFYTGTLERAWIPMMSRQSPYLREVNVTDVMKIFQFDESRHLPQSLVSYIKTTS